MLIREAGKAPVSQFLFYVIAFTLFVLFVLRYAYFPWNHSRLLYFLCIVWGLHLILVCIPYICVYCLNWFIKHNKSQYIDVNYFKKLCQTQYILPWD